jgi:hypothetical protein
MTTSVKYTSELHVTLRNSMIYHLIDFMVYHYYMALSARLFDVPRNTPCYLIAASSSQDYMLSS